MVSVAAISVLALALSACGSSEEESPPPAMTPTPSASPVAASPTPEVPAGPAMPAAAREHTEAGAEAFVEYFWEVVNYAQATGDTQILRELSATGCTGCDAGISGVEKVYANAGVILGGEARVQTIDPEVFKDSNGYFAHVQARLTFDAQTDRYPDRQTSEPERLSEYAFDLTWTGADWVVSALKAQPV